MASARLAAPAILPVPRVSASTTTARPTTVDLTNAIQRQLVENTRLGIPALFHDETAHGLRSREARARGVTVALSPVVDLARDPRYGRVEEFFGEDPHLVAQMGIASVRGQQGHSRSLGRKALS